MSSNQGFFGKFKHRREEQEEPESEALPFAANTESPEPSEIETAFDDDADFLDETTGADTDTTPTETRRVKLPEKKPFTATPIVMPSQRDAAGQNDEPLAAPAPNPFTTSQEPTAQAATPASPITSTPDSDSSSIKQLELRAIFGVDRELDREEILQRASSLPGIHKVLIATGVDLSALNKLRESIENLDLDMAPVKIHAGSFPIEFIKYGSVLLAVQVEGEFAPGVRETLMIVARELGR